MNLGERVKTRTLIASEIPGGVGRVGGCLHHSGDAIREAGNKVIPMLATEVSQLFRAKPESQPDGKERIFIVQKLNDIGRMVDTAEVGKGEQHQKVVSRPSLSGGRGDSGPGMRQGAIGSRLDDRKQVIGGDLWNRVGRDCGSEPGSEERSARRNVRLERVQRFHVTKVGACAGQGSDAIVTIG